MTTLYDIAGREAGDVAVRMTDGRALTYGELETGSRQLSVRLRRLGLSPGAHLAYLLDNRPEALVVAWAAQRAGLYYTPIATHLKVDEAAYVVADCGASAFVTSRAFEAVGEPLRARLPHVHWVDVDRVLATPDEPADAGMPEYEGSGMLYSSGTTGRPKGIRRALTGARFGSERPGALYTCHHRMDRNSVFLSPAPLYHAAPLRAALATHRLGATLVLQARFDGLDLLRAIETWRVTHVQLVPTMLHRLMELPAAERDAFDLSSLRCVIHAAAPCPPSLKRAAIEWFGPIVNEYYGGTEGAGLTYVTSEEWLSHPGSVGRAIVGRVHVVGDDGRELAAGEVGDVYFSGGPAFEYHGQPEATAASRNALGWATFGDVGRVDADGYLYLVGRRGFTINTGGVKVYPAEVEAVLKEHPLVADAVVLGVPDTEFGEQVRAVVELRAQGARGADVAQSLVEHCRSRISHVKCPKAVDLVDELPRTALGKPRRDELRRRYWPAEASP